MLLVVLIFTFVFGAADPFLTTGTMSFTIKFSSFVDTTIVVEGSALTLPLFCLFIGSAEPYRLGNLAEESYRKGCVDNLRGSDA